MATIDNTGITPKSLSEYASDLEDIFRGALGSDLSLDGETPQGQLIGSLALLLAQIDEALVFVAGGLSLESATDFQLYDWGDLLDIRRKIGTKTTVTATLTGISGTAIPRGAKAQTELEDIFVTTIASVIGNTGSVEVEMEAEEIGEIALAALSLSSPLDNISGWSGISNAADGDIGTNNETPDAYRERYRGIVAKNSLNSIQAIESSVREVDDVEYAKVFDNSTRANDEDSLNGTRILPNSFVVLVRGGIDADINEAIGDVKPLGVPYDLIKTTFVDLALTFEINAVDGVFPSDGIDLLEEYIIDWVANLAIGQPFVDSRVYEALVRVPGFNVSTPGTGVPIFALEGGGVRPAAPEGKHVYRITEDDITISIASP